MKRLILSLIIVCAQGLLMGAIPLEKAVESGIYIDAGYNNQRLELNALQVKHRQTLMNKRFKLDLSGSYLFKSENMEIAFPDSQPAPGITIPGIRKTAGAKHNYDLKLSMVQPIYTGGILSNSAEMESQKLRLEQHITALRKLAVAGEIKTSYFTYRLLQYKKKSLEVLIKNLELHRQRISDYFKENLVKKSDLLETDIKISEAEINLAELEQLIKAEKILFSRLCSLEVDNIEPNHQETVGSLDQSLNFFKSNHPVLKTVEQNIRLLQLKKKINSGQYLPQVSSFAELHYGRPGIDFFKNEWSLYFQGGISVNYKLFDWNKLKKENSVVNLSIQKLDNRKNELITDARKNLAQLYEKKKSIENQLNLLNKILDSAAEDSALKEELYKEQQVSNIDYLSSLLAVEKYRSMNDERKVEHQLVKLNINLIIGRYGEEK
jgi:outer membrane protein TolC